MKEVCLPETCARSAAQLVAFMDPNIPWRALAAQMKLAPWRAPPEGQPSPTKAAAQQMSAAWNLGPAGSMLIEHSHNTQGTADAHAKVFVAAGTGHGLVHVWQAVGWGACLWQRVAVKGQVRHHEIWEYCQSTRQSRSVRPQTLPAYTCLYSAHVSSDYGH